MASENEKRETVDDVLAEMYKESKKVRTVTRPDGYGGYEEITLEGNPYLKNLADRIGAAAKREKAQSGNAAAMREALEVAERHLTFAAEKVRGETGMRIGSGFDDAAKKCRAALSAPPRNCDEGTAEEQDARFASWRYSNPLRSEFGLDALAWAQMPYEAEEGGAK